MLTADDIWAELRRNRTTASDIAARAGVSPSTVTRTINGDTRDPNPQIIKLIAAVIGQPTNRLQPHRVSIKKPISQTGKSATSNKKRVQTAATEPVDNCSANSGSSTKMVQENTHNLIKNRDRRVA